MNTSRPPIAAVFAASLMLAACGGGDGAAGDSPSTVLADTDAVTTTVQVDDETATDGSGESETSSTESETTIPRAACENPDGDGYTENGEALETPEVTMRCLQGEWREATAPPAREPGSTSEETSDEPLPAEPFRYSYGSASEVPDFPEIEGYKQVASGSELVRIFENQLEMTEPYGFEMAWNRCEYHFWVARWSSMSADVQVIATNELFPAHSRTDYETWLLPPANPAGFMGNFDCSSPGFVYDSDGGREGNLVDVQVEWQWYVLDAFQQEPSQPDGPGVTNCSSYTYDSELPIAPCSESLSVQLLQEALGLEADGYFGPGTEQAVRSAQADFGLPVTGVIDAALWAALGVTANAPFPDLNGDGVVDASEFGE